MKVTRRFARRFRLLGLLRTSLALGAALELAAAVALVAAPLALERDLGLWLGAAQAKGPADGPPLVAVLVLLTALLLTMLALLYGMAAHDPRRYTGIVLVAILGRLAGAVLFGTLAATRPGLAGLWPVAALDATLGLVHAATWIPLRV